MNVFFNNFKLSKNGYFYILVTQNILKVQSTTVVVCGSELSQFVLSTHNQNVKA